MENTFTGVLGAPATGIDQGCFTPGREMAADHNVSICFHRPIFSTAGKDSRVSLPPLVRKMFWTDENEDVYYLVIISNLNKSRVV